MRIVKAVELLLALSLLPAGTAAGGEIVVLDERFDDNAGGWWVGDDGNVAASVQLGRMKIARRISGGWATWRTARIHQEESYRIEGTVSITADQDRYGCGLWFGAKDGNNGYVFEIGAQGMYRFFHYDNGTFVDETSWQSSSAVHPGVGAANTLSVLKKGAQWSLYVNGQYVNQVPARAFYGQNVGFRIEARMACEADRLLVVESEGPRASPTIAVGAFPSRDERMLLDEPFDSNERGWNLSRDENGSLSMEAGKLTVRHWADGGYAFWIEPGLEQADAYRIEMDVRVIEDKDNYGCGLWYGVRDVDNGFAFEVSDDGFYRQFRFEGGVFKDETAWQKHPAVRAGLGSLNQLSLVKRADRWFLYVNGTLLDRVPARPLFGGGVGVRIEGRMACEVERLRIVASGPNRIAEEPGTLLGAELPLEPPPRAARGQRVAAVLELADRTGRLRRQDVRDLTEYLRALLAARGAFALVPADVLGQAQGRAQPPGAGDCSDFSCQAAVGKAVAADLVVCTRLLRVSSDCALTAALYDVSKGATVQAVTRDTRCDVKSLMETIRELVPRL